MNLNLKLHDASKELPNKSCEVIAFTANVYGTVFNITNVQYSHKYKRFNCWDHFEEDMLPEREFEVTWWAEMPKTIESKKKR